jgi:hypothetical protein
MHLVNLHDGVTVCGPFFLPVLHKSAHPAFDFVEFAANLKAAFSPCKLVQFVKRFINFRDTVEPLLNNCANTPGAEHFGAFRYQVLLVNEIHKKTL